MSEAKHWSEQARPAAMALVSVLSVVGIGICVYMTQHHEISLYGGENMQMELWGCAEAEGVNCDVVNTSDWSELFGVPLFTWGLPFYALLAYLSAASARARRDLVTLIGLLGAAASVYSLLLWYVSVHELGNVCLWCKRLYGVNFAVAGLALAAGGFRLPRPTKAALLQAGGLWLALTVIAVGAQKAYRSTLLGDAGATALASVEHNEGGAEAAWVHDVEPKGAPPAISFDVVTEDKKSAVLTVEPDDAWKGNPNAKVAVVEFADLQCGYCKRASAQLKRLYEAYGDQVVVVYKHYPMDPSCNPGVNNRRHVYACGAAVASVCAQDQGKFWAFHDLAYKNQHQLKAADLRVYAQKVGLDMPTFEQCVRAPASLARVRADATAGAALDIHGTPRIFINGRLYRAGNSAEQLAQAIEVALGHTGPQALDAARALADAGEDVTPIPADVPAMQEVRYGELHFAIDTFEAGLTNGAATSGKHEIPGVRMSWFAAKDACAAAGKRLCTEQEWIAACQGALPVDDNSDGHYADDLIEGTAYPYSDYHTPGRCWDGRDRGDFRPVYTGEMPGCVSRDGVYDLTGNVEEWVGDSPERAVLMGGAYDTTEDHARCYRPNDTFGPGFANVRTGFRCCKTLE